jgi:hypothetical protein
VSEDLSASEWVEAFATSPPKVYSELRPPRQYATAQYHMLLRAGEVPTFGSLTDDVWSVVYGTRHITASPAAMAQMGYRYGHPIPDDQVASLRLTGQLLGSGAQEGTRVCAANGMTLEDWVAGYEFVMQSEAKEQLPAAQGPLAEALGQRVGPGIGPARVEPGGVRYGYVMSDDEAGSLRVPGRLPATQSLDAANRRITELEADLHRLNQEAGEHYKVMMSQQARIGLQAQRIAELEAELATVFADRSIPNSPPGQADMRPVPRKGDFVTCESGCLVCEVVDDRPALGAFRDENAAKGHDLCACGAIWWNWRKGSIHLKNRGWSAETRLPCWWLGNEAFPADEVANDASDAAYLYHGNMPPRLAWAG